ncbi:MAG TPA: TIGR03085 family metal-binding protein [Nocardioides sp.]|nr:TIGR03085 family metal-binding protein [Nocardioides sp.]
MTSLAHRERLALCDTALREGPDAPTLCDPWDVRRLVGHLLVRERSPLGAAGISISPLSGLTERAMAGLEGKDFGVLVDRLRRPPKVPFALPGLDRAVNTVEFVVHHEDIRRARPGWEPRVLDVADEGTIWTFLRLAGRGMARRAGVPVRIEWGERAATLRGGDGPVVLRGTPIELALLLAGRQRVAQVEYDGPPEAVSRMRDADLGV